MNKPKSPPKPEKLLITRGSGNVFADLGFAGPEATNLQMRADLMLAIEKWFRTSGLTQAMAAKQLGVSQPRLNLVLKGKIDQCSLDALVNLAGATGMRLKLSSTQPRGAAVRKTA
jgi:predicted XRE-type DNA-binding protein